MIEHIQFTIDKLQLYQGDVLLWGDVDEAQAQYIIERMRYVFHRLDLKDIYLYIHSDGGCVNAACAIIDEIIGLKKLGAKIHTIALGKAYSCAADILSIGTERYATALTSMMLHPMSFGASVDYIEYQARYTEYVQKQADLFNRIVAIACGYKTKAEIAKFATIIKHSVLLIGEEAVEFGLIDQLWDYSWELDKKKYHEPEQNPC